MDYHRFFKGNVHLHLSANFELCLIAHQNSRNEKSSNLMILHEVFLAIMCLTSEKCVLQECQLCLGAEGLTVQTLNISKELACEEITFALRNKDDL